MNNNLTERRAHLLRRWGLVWIIIGFLFLLQEIFGTNFFLTFLALVLIGIARPETAHRTDRVRSMLVYAGYLVIFILLFYGLTRLIKAFVLNDGLVLSVTSLSIGIILQIWEILWRSRLSGNDAAGRMINKIRRL